MFSVIIVVIALVEEVGMRVEKRRGNDEAEGRGRRWRSMRDEDKVLLLRVVAVLVPVVAVVLLKSIKRFFSSALVWHEVKVEDACVWKEKERMGDQFFILGNAWTLDMVKRGILMTMVPECSRIYAFFVACFCEWPN